MKYLKAIREEPWKSFPVVEKIWGLSLGSMLTRLHDCK